MENRNVAYPPLLSRGGTSFPPRRALPGVLVLCQAERANVCLIDYRDAKPREPIPTKFLVAARLNLPGRDEVIYVPHGLKVKYLPANNAAGLRHGPRGSAMGGDTSPRSVTMAVLGSRIK